MQPNYWTGRAAPKIKWRWKEVWVTFIHSVPSVDQTFWSRAGGVLWSYLQIQIWWTELERGAWRGPQELDEAVWSAQPECPHFSSNMTRWLLWMANRNRRRCFLPLGRWVGDRRITGHYPTFLTWEKQCFPHQTHIKGNSDRDWAGDSIKAFLLMPAFSPPMDPSLLWNEGTAEDLLFSQWRSKHLQWAGLCVRMD